MSATKTKAAQRGAAQITTITLEVPAEFADLIRRAYKAVGRRGTLQEEILTDVSVCLGSDMESSTDVRGRPLLRCVAERMGFEKLTAPFYRTTQDKLREIAGIN